MGISDQIKEKKRPGKKSVKVRMIMQMEAAECGAACLAMVLDYYGKHISLEEARHMCGVSRDGSSAAGIVRAARQMNMSADGFRVKDTSVIPPTIEFPCILFWNNNHFVVLRGVSFGKALINDPAWGSYAVDMEEFSRSFSGVCIMLKPDEGFETGGEKEGMLHYAFMRVIKSGSVALFVLLVVLLLAIISVLEPAFSRIFMDKIIGDRFSGIEELFFNILWFVTVAHVVVLWVRAVGYLRINAKLAVSEVMSFFWHAIRLPVSFFEQRSSGDIVRRMEFCESISMEVINVIVPLVTDTILMVVYLCVMLQYSLPLTIVGLLGVLMNIVVSLIVSQSRINATRVLEREEGKLSTAITTGASMIETIKAGGVERGYFEIMAGSAIAINNQQVRMVKLNALAGMLPELISKVSTGIVLCMSCFLVIKGELTMGMVMAFLGYLDSFMVPTKNMINAGQTVGEMITRSERIDDVLSYSVQYGDEDFRADIGLGEEKLEGAVEVRNLTFGYNPVAPPVVRDFSMSVKPGQCVAIVGTSGCGKSTIAKLIAGIYEPWEGEILFDGKRRNEYDRPTLCASIAMASQDMFFFADSIENNIKLWDESIEEYEMVMSAVDAGIHDFVMSSPGGYNYQLTDGAGNVSGGQRQRLGLARTLAQDPTIMILDEGTSALDAQTESQILASIRERGVTCIMIAHRLSAIRDCDEIIVLDKGVVVQRGTHNELLEEEGIYRDLVRDE